MKKLITPTLLVALLLLIAPEWILAQVAGFNISGNTSKCRNAVFQFNNTSTGANSYVWDFGDGSPTSTDVNPTHFYTNGGTYVVTLTAGNGTSMSTYQKAVYVKEYPSAYFGWSGFNDFYPMDQIKFENYSNRSVGYLWDFGDGTTSTRMNPKKVYTTPGPKDIVLKAYNDCGDTSVNQQTLEIIDTANVIPSASGYISSYISCPNRKITFYNYSSHFDYVVWNFGNGQTQQTTLEEIQYAYTQPGSYTVKLYAYRGTKVDSTDFTITVSNTLVSLPYSSVSPQRMVNSNYIYATCPSKPFNLYSSFNDNISKSYWRMHDGTRFDTSQVNISYSATGTYSIWFVAENHCGAKDSILYTLYVLNSDTFSNNLGSIQVTPIQGYVCPGGKMKLRAGYSPGTDFSYAWKINGTPAGNNFELEHTFPNTSAIHTVTVSITPQCGVVDSITRNVYTSTAANPISSFDVNMSETRANCYKDTLHLSTEYYDEYVLNPVSHFWDFGDGFTSTQINPSHVFATSGWHSIIHRTTNNCGVSDITATTVHLVSDLAPTPRFYAYPNVVCADDEVLFDNFTMGADSMVIEYGDGTREIFGGDHMPHIFHSYATPGKKTATLYAYNRCSGDSVSISIDVLAKPAVQILMNDTQITVGTELTFHANLLGLKEHLWYRSSNATDTSTAASITKLFSTVGTYKVYLHGKNDKGCDAMDSVTINVILSGSVVTLTDENARLTVYPNPLTSQLNVKMELLESVNAEVSLYSIQGSLIGHVFKGNLPSGTHHLNYNTDGLSKGVYFCRMKINNTESVKKIIKQ